MYFSTSLVKEKVMSIKVNAFGYFMKDYRRYFDENVVSDNLNRPEYQ